MTTDTYSISEPPPPTPSAAAEPVGLPEQLPDDATRPVAAVSAVHPRVAPPPGRPRCLWGFRGDGDSPTLPASAARREPPSRQERPEGRLPRPVEVKKRPPAEPRPTKPQRWKGPALSGRQRQLEAVAVQKRSIFQSTSAGA